jgi:hypothetical protein
VIELNDKYYIHSNLYKNILDHQFKLSFSFFINICIIFNDIKAEKMGA